MGERNKTRDDEAMMAGSHKFESDVVCPSALLDRALEIARKRRQILVEMRAAIQRADKEAVFSLAKKLTGLNDETCSRTDSRFN